MITETHPLAIKLCPCRPCRPGDVLVRLDTPCGAYAEIVVADPPKHPDRGVADVEAVAMRLEVYLPANPGQYGTLLNDLQADIDVLGQYLRGGWGENVNGYRMSWQVYRGESIASLVDKAVIAGNDALSTVQAIADQHAQSVRNLADRRVEAYAAYPVADVPRE